MGGVPGQSKGCNTCRKRRVGCDETKPACLRCAKGGFKCLGYVRHRIWRNSSTAPFPQPSSLSKKLHHRTPHVTDEATHSITGSGGRRTSPPPELSLVAFQGEICFAFMFSNFVWRSYGAPWLERAAAGRLGPLALHATRALSQANFGKSNHKYDLELQGAMHYGKCLRELAQILTDENPMDAQYLLVPILVLLMYAASSADKDGAVSHLKGIARLLQLCGPCAFRQSPMLEAFEAARATLLVASLHDKQRLFLETEEWRTIPWAANPMSRSPQSELLDIFITIPGILENYTASEGHGELPQADRLTVLTRVEEQLVAAYKWRWMWQVQAQHCIGVDVSPAEVNGGVSTTLGSIGSSRKLSRLRFSKFVHATDLMLYNATLMWLMALVWKIEPLDASSHVEQCAFAATPSDADDPYTSFGPLRRPGAAVTIRDPAMEICRAFEWVSRHHSQSSDPIVLYLFPVGMALCVLEPDPKDWAWVKGLLDSNPITRNYSKGQNPAGFGDYIIQEALHPYTT